MKAQWGLLNCRFAKQANTGDADQGCRVQGNSGNLCVSPVTTTISGSWESLCNNASECLSHETDSSWCFERKKRKNQYMMMMFLKRRKEKWEKFLSIMMEWLRLMFQLWGWVDVTTYEQPESHFLTSLCIPVFSVCDTPICSTQSVI